MTSTSPSTIPLELALQQAIGHHQAGRLQEAEQLYRAILQAEPNQADANHNLGMIACQVGQFAAALPYLKTALLINPAQGQYSLSYAEALLASGQPQEALVILDGAMKRGVNSAAMQALNKKIISVIQGNQSHEHKNVSESDQLVALFSNGKYAELELKASALVEKDPNSGFGWKILGAALQMQGKDSLHATHMAAKLLSDAPDIHSNLGIVLRNHGNLDESVKSFRRAIRIKPDFAEAHNNLGATLQDLGQLEDAIASYRRAIQIKPNYAEAYNNLGNVLRELKRLDEAVINCRHAVECKHDYANAHNNLANALRDNGQYEEAEASYRRALILKPDFVMAYCGIGLALNALGKREDAMAHYRKAIEINPNYFEAHTHIGNALRDVDRPGEAMLSYRRALEIKPDFFDAYFNLANILRAFGNHDEAIEVFHRVLAFNPNSAEAHNSLGNLLLEIGQAGGAIENYRRALQLAPKFAVACSNLGSAFRELGNFNDAVASCRRAIEIAPDFAMGYNNLGNAFRDLGQLDDAVIAYCKAVELDSELAIAHNNLGCVLRDRGHHEDAVISLRRAMALKPDYVAAYDNFLMTLQFIPTITQQDIFDAHKNFGEKFEAPLKSSWPAHTNRRDPDKRLKIGYVSGDFRRHVVAYFIEPILTYHDKSKVEVYCYANSTQQDVVVDNLMGEADHWVPCYAMSDVELAQRIVADGIDILIDLSGHTARNRLLAFARKPAPIQITYLGYPGTSGMSAIDYRLTDRYTEPEGSGADQYYTEQLLRLPDSMWCYRPAEDMPEITPLPALANGYLTFGSFNNANKIGSECIALWAALLRSLPSSRLMMATVPEGEMREHLAAQFLSHGIARDRIDFCAKLLPQDFQRALQQVDIALDPFPVNGATTTCESLWLGVPVLTLVGDRFLSRAGLSTLNAAHLSEFAASNQEKFIKTAISLANDLSRLAALRANLRERLKSTPLFDQQRFTRNLEDIYRNAWCRYALQ
jgi:protein O-GlcNAc transferase